MEKLDKGLEKKEKKQFTKLDKNKDGKVDVDEEIAKSKDLFQDEFDADMEAEIRDYFKSADKDNDGGLSFEEFENFGNSQGSGNAGVETPAPTPPAEPTLAEPAPAPAPEPAPAHWS